MDVSSIQATVHQLWTVDADGKLATLLGDETRYGCIVCGMGFGGWDVTAEHCRSVHSPEGVASRNGGGFSDSVGVGSVHAVELEPPSEAPPLRKFAVETLREGDWPEASDGE